MAIMAPPRDKKKENEAKSTATGTSPADRLLEAVAALPLAVAEAPLVLAAPKAPDEEPDSDDPDDVPESPEMYALKSG
jgi:hypothetical protein